MVRAAALLAWWPLLLAVPAVAAWAVGAFGARVGIPGRLERLYVAVTVLACGIWGALAAAFGPRTSPLPQALGLGGLVLAVPWWANRGRRAKVRVERTIATWPYIAEAVEIVGSQITSATVDLWGWRARLRLARGQTITDVMSKVPAIESGFGTHRNAVRVYPSPDDLANRRAARAGPRPPRRRDPVARPVGHLDHGADRPGAVRGRRPVPRAVPAPACPDRRHALVGGATGLGNSGGLNELLASLVACRDVVIWAVDLKRGMEMQPWAACIDRLATKPAEAAVLLADAVTILYAMRQCPRAVWMTCPAAASSRTHSDREAIRFLRGPSS